jgi:hypothetical protein
MNEVNPNAINRWLYNKETVDKILQYLMEHGKKDVSKPDRIYVQVGTPFLTFTRTDWERLRSLIEKVWSDQDFVKVWDSQLLEYGSTLWHLSLGEATQTVRAVRDHLWSRTA